MEKKFLININCSKILANFEATQYTMFIDSSKMSIVYELVEWIRWMFSLKCCINLMHENSVIHELEDIQLLSELKNFEIIPCGGSNCVHKNIYRTLLEDLNLVVSWKDKKVHKYFLDKINQMSQKLTQESTKSYDLSNATLQNLMTFNTETDNNINSGENKLQSSENPSRNSRGKSSKTKNARSPNSNKSSPHISPLKKVLQQISAKNQTKPKPIKPFSVGETLLALRKDLKEKNTENIFPSLIPEGRNFESKIITVKNSFSEEGKSTKVRKRLRVRKRRPKKQTAEAQGFTSFNSGDKASFSPFTIAKSNSSIKPYHIRFDADDDDDDDKMQLECIRAPNKNEFEINSEESHNSSTSAVLQKNEFDDLVSLSTDADHDDSQQSTLCFSEKNASYNIGCLFVPDNEITREEKVTDAQDDLCDKVNQSSMEPSSMEPSSLEQNQLNNSTHDLNDLLSLREKFKNGVVFERF